MAKIKPIKIKRGCFEYMGYNILQPNIHQPWTIQKYDGTNVAECGTVHEAVAIIDKLNQKPQS